MKLADAVHFADAVGKVFDTMVGLEVQTDAPKVLSEGSPTADVTGIVTFAGDLVGAMILTFPTAVIRDLVKRFADLDCDVKDPDFLDAVGELANMVAGQAKSRFEGYDAMISVPTVVCGPAHHVNRHKSAPWVVVPASCEAGRFVVAMSLQGKKH
ncbi:MAG: chemotaxis protein CheX [Planctomycetota bacterium]